MKHEQDTIDQVVQTLRTGDDPDQWISGADAACWPPDLQERLFTGLLAFERGRRWLRGHLLPQMQTGQAGALAERLLAWRDDFTHQQRDRTTAEVIRALPLAVACREAPFLAGTNAANALWERLWEAGHETVAALALRVLREGDRAARETTLHQLLLDPFGPRQLSWTDRGRLLDVALDDPDDEVRGLAAEVAADEAPDRLLRAVSARVRDPSERVRMATWDAAFAADYEQAVEDATWLIGDEEAPLDARRSALLTLGELLPTARVAPVLAMLVTHPDPLLAADAANLLWTRHRTPSVAEAALQSPHEPVREIAERLLHPERGSPAAGGSRPGAPNARTDIYEEMLRLRGIDPDDGG